MTFFITKSLIFDFIQLICTAIHVLLKGVSCIIPVLFSNRAQEGSVQYQGTLRLRNESSKFSSIRVTDHIHSQERLVYRGLHLSHANRVTSKCALPNGEYRGGARGGLPPPPPLIFRSNWCQKGRKKFLWDRASPYPRVWMTVPPPPPSLISLLPAVIIRLEGIPIKSYLSILRWFLITAPSGLYFFN